LIAIPAIVALFKLDAQKGFWPLFATGGIFVLGLIVTRSASLCGYLAFWQLREWHLEPGPSRSLASLSSILLRRETKRRS
jgi:hypothetical protein